MYVCALCYAMTMEARRGSQIPEIELQVVNSLHVGAGSEPRSLEGEPVLLAAEPSPQPLVKILTICIKNIREGFASYFLKEGLHLYLGIPYLFIFIHQFCGKAKPECWKCEVSSDHTT